MVMIWFPQWLFTVVFGLVLLIMAVKIGQALMEWLHNQNSPRLSAEVEIVGKHLQTSTTSSPVAGDMTGTHDFSNHTSTTYYVTAQFLMAIGKSSESKVQTMEC